MRLRRVVLRDVVLNAVIGSYLVPRTQRWRLLRLFGFDVQRSTIAARCFFGGPRVSIGRGTFVNYRAFFDTSAPITVGGQCRIGMDVLFCTSSHRIGGHERRGGAHENAPITVGDGVWIGARVTVLPGARIPDGCVVAAGAVVPGSLAMKPDALYAGVPARWMNDLPLESPDKPDDPTAMIAGIAPPAPE